MGSGPRLYPQKQKGGELPPFRYCAARGPVVLQPFDSAFLPLALAFFLPSDLAVFLLVVLAGAAGVADCAGVAGVAGGCAAAVRGVPADAASITTAVHLFLLELPEKLCS